MDHLHFRLLLLVEYCYRYILSIPVFNALSFGRDLVAAVGLTSPAVCWYTIVLRDDAEEVVPLFSCHI